MATDTRDRDRLHFANVEEKKKKMVAVTYTHISCATSRPFFMTFFTSFESKTEKKGRDLGPIRLEPVSILGLADRTEFLWWNLDIDKEQYVHVQKKKIRKRRMLLNV